MGHRVQVWRGRIKDRQLASDNRAGSWARAEARRRQYKFLRETWRQLAPMLLAATAFTAGVAWLAPAGFWRGLAVGVLGTTAIALIGLVTIEVTGTAGVQMGSTAEQWSASELRPLRKNGWRLINRFLLGRSGDVDHLLVGPAGVIVAETKWRSAGWQIQPPDEHLLDALHQVTRNADQVRKWEPVKATGCPVRPVLFLWGRAADEPDEATRQHSVISTVTVIRGAHAAGQWRKRVAETPPVLSKPAAEALTTAIQDHLAKRDKNEAARQPAPPTVERLYWTVFGCFLTGSAGIMAMLELLSRRLYWLASAAGVVGIVLGAYLRRWPELRLMADAWLAGVIGVGVLAAVLTAVM